MADEFLLPPETVVKSSISVGVTISIKGYDIALSIEEAKDLYNRLGSIVDKVVISNKLNYPYGVR